MMMRLNRFGSSWRFWWKPSSQGFLSVKRREKGVQAPIAAAAQEMVAEAPQAEEAADQTSEAAEEPEAEATVPVPAPRLNRGGC